VMTFLNGYAQSIGMSDGASLYFVVYAATMLVVRLFMGRVQDRYGDNPVVIPALCAFAVSMALLAWSPNQGVMVASGVLAGFGFGSLLPAIQAIIASKLRTYRISIGISTFFIMMDLGFGLAPLLLGPLVDLWGFHVMYAGCAGVVVGSIILYWLVHGKFGVKQGVARRHTYNWVNDATGVMPHIPPKNDDDGDAAPSAKTPTA
jgi:MFS family permease